MDLKKVGITCAVVIAGTTAIALLPTTIVIAGAVGFCGGGIAVGWWNSKEEAKQE